MCLEESYSRLVKREKYSTFSSEIKSVRSVEGIINTKNVYEIQKCLTLHLLPLFSFLSVTIKNDTLVTSFCIIILVKPL